MSDDPESPKMVKTVPTEIEAAAIVAQLGSARHQRLDDGQFHVWFSR